MRGWIVTVAILLTLTVACDRKSRCRIFAGILIDIGRGVCGRQSRPRGVIRQGNRDRKLARRGIGVASLKL
jgi:hypothetical protein